MITSGQYCEAETQAGLKKYGNTYTAGRIGVEGR